MSGKRDIGRRGSLPIIVLLLAGLAAYAPTEAADPPCDKYPAAKERRCTEIWAELNREDAAAIAQFGLDQQKRRDAGAINAQQHLAENMLFIRQSTDKRLERLKDTMAKE
ncbi:MAG: hypothetical protein ICV75_06270 [Nitrospiraceae bacterium]|nr:hypothetical protein [Nitrospiraceae bacterium]